MHYPYEESHMQVAFEPEEKPDTGVELARSKAKLRKVEELVRRFETRSDGLGFLAGKVLEVLEDKDA